MTEEREVKTDSEELVQDVAPAGQPGAESQMEQVVELEGDVAEEGEATDELAALRMELEEARAKEAEYLDGWQRARAELANARKRFQKEQQQSYSNAKADVLIRLLPIIDDFERAIETLPEDLQDHRWVEGIKLIQCKAQGLLEQEGVAPIDAVGQEFDPFRHQAVTHEPCDDVPEGHVIGQMQRGYRLGDRVLRPCMARVSAGPPPEPEPEEGAGAEEQSSGAEEAASAEQS